LTETSIIRYLEQIFMSGLMFPEDQPMPSHAEILQSPQAENWDLEIEVKLD